MSAAKLESIRMDRVRPGPSMHLTLQTLVTHSLRSVHLTLQTSVTHSLRSMHLTLQTSVYLALQTSVPPASVPGRTGAKPCSCRRKNAKPRLAGRNKARAFGCLIRVSRAPGRSGKMISREPRRAHWAKARTCRGSVLDQRRPFKIPGQMRGP